LLAPHEIVQALRITRAEFARIFLQAQIDRPASKRIEAEAVFKNPDRDLAFKEALLFARNKGFLREFTLLAANHKLEDGRITKALANEQSGGAALQAIRNAVDGLPHAHLIYQGFADAMRWTCGVEVDGHISGTGFLVGPNLVLTAWHVMSALFTANIRPDGTTTYVPREGPQNIAFHFDDLLVSVAPDLLAPIQRSRIEADHAWHVAHSCCHDEELNDQLPTHLSQLNGLWDYCVVRLKLFPGLERRWAQLEANAVCPDGNETVFLFHHPAGKSMRANFSKLSAFAAADAAARELRFLHQMNSLPGSSGGPCFDKTFSLFGIHQGVWKAGPDGANRGVPITRIIQHLRENGGLPAPDPNDIPLLRAGVGDYALPIVGRDDFQSLVWGSVTKGEPRLISIGGDGKLGKTFCAEILEAMLPDGHHLKIAIEAETIAKMSAPEFAQTICAAANATLPALKPDEFASTGAAFQKDCAVVAVMDALNAIRGRRTVWLILKNLNRSPIDGVDLKDLLLLIFGQTKDRTWFRVVLDGFQSDIPGQLSMRGEHTPRPVEKDQLVKFLQRFAALEGLPPDNFDLHAGVILRASGRAGADRLARLSGLVIDYMLELQERNNGGR
jgi:hypothetical protein